VARRSKVEIYQAILLAIHLEGNQFQKASPTRVAHQANLPYDRFQKILEHLIKKGLVIQKDDGFIMTEKGISCLEEIQRNNDFLKRMGLS
jgi:predicted transcriptional regulator